ncbi:SDR family NAD(P)-dependent oxidoreductase [Granulicella sp. WH15]|uniref:SDR family NAD(P)-dependent oxidoreductase n=1 Tax=Granulicella sp. WH15 TaxID=2602070 RepID=UPI001366AFF3|nr:SDR family NAD(P)-dependent oxidoreductase [Granulicella sp. WH15]QHN02437.1 SDR family NAD(P)-dependent oxidoreductase [Granulicella sp. WH15]
MGGLKGRVALVTGGSRGIGRACAIALAEAGCVVAVNYLASEAAAQEVVAAIHAGGGEGFAVQCDVSSEPQVAEMVAAIESRCGAIDIAVNNAGISIRRPLAEITSSDWERSISQNLTSAFLVSQAVLPGMRERRWGRLIFVSSIAAQSGGVIGPHYAASKAGMLGLTHSYASLLAKEGITSNAIAPALVVTDMIRGNNAAKPELLPVGRFGEAEEVAEAVVMVAGNGFMTGQTINLNGGWYMS